MHELEVRAEELRVRRRLRALLRLQYVQRHPRLVRARRPL